MVPSDANRGGTPPSPAQLYERTRPLTERIDEILETPCDTLADEARVLTEANSILNAELR